jgi:hypothetical protein
MIIAESEVAAGFKQYPALASSAEAPVTISRICAI